MILSVYVLGLLALALHPPPLASPSEIAAAATVLAALAAWQAGWSLWHQMRARLFERRRFPALRRAAGADGEGSAGPPHLYIVLTRVASRAETTARVVQAALDAAVRWGGPSTLLAGPAEPGERRLIKQTFLRLAPPEHVRLVFVPWRGARTAVLDGLRAVVRARADVDAAVTVITGDTLIPSTTFESCLPFLRWDPDLDLLLTDQAGIGASGPTAAWLGLIRAESRRRMLSLALAGSVDLPDDQPIIIRAGLLTTGGLLDLVDQAERRSGAGGRFELPQLIWLELIRRRRAMLYLPDVALVRVDEGDGGFFATSSAIIRRRSQRARLLLRHLSGPAPAASSAVVRLCLIERLATPALSLLAWLVVVALIPREPAALLWAALLWAGAMGLLHALGLLAERPRVHGLWPLLAVYDRLLDAAALVAALGRRSPAGRRTVPRRFSGPPLAPARGPASPTSAMLHGLLLAVLVVAVALIVHLLDLPPLAGPVPAF